MTDQIHDIPLEIIRPAPWNPASRLARALAWLESSPGGLATIAGFVAGVLLMLTVFACYWQRADALLTTAIRG